MPIRLPSEPRDSALYLKGYHDAKLDYEVKHGRWIYEGKKGRFPACRCSECGNVENADWAVLGDNVNYCPNCGAKMDLEEEENA